MVFYLYRSFRKIQTEKAFIVLALLKNTHPLSPFFQIAPHYIISKLAIHSFFSMPLPKFPVSLLYYFVIFGLFAKLFFQTRLLYNSRIVSFIITGKFFILAFFIFGAISDGTWDLLLGQLASNRTGRIFMGQSVPSFYFIMQLFYYLRTLS